jgi:iron complex outermembrane receptor protein
LRAYAAEKEIELEPIVVNVGAFSQLANIPTKGISVLRVDMDKTHSVSEILDYHNGIDISTRGILGIQSDLTIRGSTQEQVQFSINGLNLDDPQTAHHDLDIAVPSAAIERIEVARGPSPLGWGQAAIGGAVNVVTKAPDRDECEVSFLYGTDEMRRSSIYLSRNEDSNGINFSAEESASNGWRFDTDFRQFAVSSSALFDLTDIFSNYIFAGYCEKEFGASNFYGLYDSKEWTDTFFFNWNPVIARDDFKFTPQLYFRRHHDKYMLDIKSPNRYINHHRTDVEGVKIEVQKDTKSYGFFTTSADIKKEGIKSTRLGKDALYTNTYLFSWRNYSNRLFGFDASLRIDDHSQYQTEFLPQAGAFLILSPHIRLRSHIAKASRPPTFTELYYDSPSNKGSRGLSPEEALNYEAGADIFLGEANEIRLSCTLFRRDSKDLIDWVKYAQSESFYQAANITEVKTEGLEAEANASLLDWLTIGVNYSYIDSDIKKGQDYISKYALRHPDHKLAAEAGITLPIGIQKIRMIYKDRKDYSHYLIMGIELNCKMNRYGRFFISVDNLFNSSHEDIKNLPYLFILQFNSMPIIR